MEDFVTAAMSANIPRMIQFVRIAVEERVPVAPPLYPDLIPLLEAGEDGKGARVPVVLLPGLALVVVDHPQHLPALVPGTLLVEGAPHGLAGHRQSWSSHLNVRVFIPRCFVIFVILQ